MHLRKQSLPFIIALFVATASVWAGDGCPHCGCQDGVCYEEIVTYRCKLVPDVKPIKKTVYECKDVPYCDHALPKFGHCDGCPQCKACPKFKKVLIKKEIICGETCGTKCVVEEVRQRVPVPCCRCGHAPCDHGQPAPPIAEQPTGPASPKPLVDKTTGFSPRLSPIFVAEPATRYRITD